MVIGGKEVVNYKNSLYWIYRKVKESQIKTEYISEIKEFWMCDMVIKGKYQSEENYYLFLREIPEAEIVKDII